MSVLVASSSPACNVANSSALNGLPCASVRLSRPTSKMSIAPSSPPCPSEGADMWKMPSSNDRTLLHATPVPRTIATASAVEIARAVRTVRTTRCADITLDYLCNGALSGSQPRRARGVPDSNTWRAGQKG
ncbi:Uncharacterised protein [Mycobacterium tuberculosis]|uniref:Uncharacterized protein n=1 Tax=Mycobacterium tuberculosis TaxID=1773 RepID=A0A0U0TQQ2_MYCTX|nr:Uncharacterised protein [Mycobacterium tuberculosis]CKO64081.1 Uncharacterised protein [Mycobacterium tuberculosis]CKR65028.1 Uncharacterised protein [Mycobacterium tuberculosis]CKT14256.1 Uncharacterised protein [Mycobacterium tuberculosis]CNL13487.1 Uncharacterised protein [Mycobacterium tuberculosis]